MSEVSEQEFLHVECDCVPNLGQSHCHLCGRLKKPIVWPCEYADAMAAHDERVRAEERERLIGNLRWLAKSRAEYCRLPHADEDAAIRAYHESSRLMQVLHDEHTTAEAIADLLDGSNDGMGWLPSWRWDEWRAIRAVSEQEEQ